MGPSFFHLANPFVLLLAIPLLIFFWRRHPPPASFNFSSLGLVSGLNTSWRIRMIHSVDLLRCLVYLLLLFALARPQLGNRTTEILSEGIDILLTIDTSGSMKALDFQLKKGPWSGEANRLDVVKKVVADFISRRPYDRMGMVIFGDEAYTQCPLTQDKETLKKFLDLIHIGIVGDGTAIGNALATSVKRLKDQPTKSKIIILLTDGRSNAGEISPMKAAEIAKEFGIKVYTIAVGGHGPVPYPQDTPFGVRRIYAQLDMDAETLQAIAATTGGQYYHATQTEELEKIYATIDQLEKSEVKIKEYQEFQELYASFVIMALILLMTELLLRQTIFLTLP